MGINRETKDIVIEGYAGEEFRLLGNMFKPLVNRLFSSSIGQPEQYVLGLGERWDANATRICLKKSATYWPSIHAASKGKFPLFSAIFLVLFKEYEDRFSNDHMSDQEEIKRWITGLESLVMFREKFFSQKHLLFEAYYHMRFNFREIMYLLSFEEETCGCQEIAAILSSRGIADPQETIQYDLRVREHQMISWILSWIVDHRDEEVQRDLLNYLKASEFKLFDSTPNHIKIQWMVKLANICCEPSIRQALEEQIFEHRPLPSAQVQGGADTLVGDLYWFAFNLLEGKYKDKALQWITDE